MQRFLLLLSGAAVAFGMQTAAAQGPTVVWANLIDGSTSAGDQATAVAVDASGNTYWYGSYGSTAADPDVFYAGEMLFAGAPIEVGNTQNNNYTLLKTDKDGNKLWCVYSNCGDFANNSGFCAVTPDGGIVTASKVRHTDGMTDKNIVLNNADGTPYEIDWTSEKRYYRMAVTKISAEGQIEWNRMVDFSTVPGPAAAGNYSEFWGDVFDVTGGTVDDEGNIYVALNYRNPVTVAAASGEPVVLSPANTENWTGDTQTTCGAFLLLSLDNEGYYRSNLQLDGDCVASYCQKVEYADGRLYCQGYAIGEEGATLKAGNFTLAPSTVISPVVMAMDTDLKLSWANCYKGEEVDGKKALQNTAITPCRGALYFCGQYNLKFSDAADPAKFVTSEQGSLREGFVVKLDATTGEWLAARDSRSDDWDKPSAVAKTGLTGYLKVIPNPVSEESVFVFGYVMNAQVGVFLREYNASTLEGVLPEGQYNIVTGGGVPSALCGALDMNNGAFYMNARGNKAFTLINGTETAEPLKWGVLAARFDLGTPLWTGVSTPEVITDEMPVEYYTLQGIRVANPGQGIYIRRQGSDVKKVVL